jgi:hypothetical protein
MLSAGNLTRSANALQGETAGESLFLWDGKMHNIQRAINDITVIGPINGLYHLGYYSQDKSKFFTYNTFICRELAIAAIGRVASDSLGKA